MLDLSAPLYQSALEKADDTFFFQLALERFREKNPSARDLEFHRLPSWAMHDVLEAAQIMKTQRSQDAQPVAPVTGILHGAERF